MKLTILSRHTVYALFSVFLIIPRSFAEQPDAILSGNNNLIPVATPSYTKPTLTENIIIPGDVNGDGKVTEADAELVLQFAAGILTPTEAQIQAADLKGDGQITSADAIKIQRIASGLDLLSSAVVIPVPSVTLDNAPAAVSTDILETTPVATDSLTSQLQGSSEAVTPETSYHPDSQQMQETAALSTSPIGLLLDVNGDGVVDNRDRDAILQYSIGSIVEKTEDTTKNLFNNVTRYSVTQDSAGYSAGIITNKPILSGEANFDKSKADTNGDGKINAQDAIVFLNLETKTSDQALKEGWLPRVSPGNGLALLKKGSVQPADAAIEEAADTANPAGDNTLAAIAEEASSQGVSILDSLPTAATAATFYCYAPIEPMVKAAAQTSQERVDEIVSQHSEAINIQTNNDATAKKTIALWNNASDGISRASIREAASDETLKAVAEEQAGLIVDAWIEDLRYTKKQSEAIAALTKIGPQIIESLSTKGFNYEDERVRGLTVVVIGEIGGSLAVDSLKRAMDDEYFDVRKTAAYYLGKIDDPRTCAILVDALSDKSFEVSDTAEEALKRKGASAVPFLINNLGTSDQGVYKRISAIFSKIGQAAVEPLISILVDKNEGDIYRIRAEELLQLIAPPQIVKSYLETQIDKTTDPASLLLLQQELKKVDEKIKIIADVGTRYSIVVDYKFNIEGLTNIVSALDILGPELVSGLQRIYYDPKQIFAGVHLFNTICFNSDKPGLYSILHELTHDFDDTHPTLDPGELYNESNSPIDFAPGFGINTTRDKKEDSATVAVAYFKDSIGAFNRAIIQTEAGYPVYLKKMLRRLNILSGQIDGDGRPTGTMVQFYKDGKIIAEESLARDSYNNLVAIGGISIYIHNLDGTTTFNIAGLKEFFKDLENPSNPSV